MALSDNWLPHNSPHQWLIFEPCSRLSVALPRSCASQRRVARPLGFVEAFQLPLDFHELNGREAPIPIVHLTISYSSLNGVDKTHEKNWVDAQCQRFPLFFDNASS